MANLVSREATFTTTFMILYLVKLTESDPQLQPQNLTVKDEVKNLASKFQEYQTVKSNSDLGSLKNSDILNRYNVKVANSNPKSDSRGKLEEHFSPKQRISFDMPVVKTLLRDKENSLDNYWSPIVGFSAENWSPLQEQKILLEQSHTKKTKTYLENVNHQIAFDGGNFQGMKNKEISRNDEVSFRRYKDINNHEPDTSYQSNPREYRNVVHPLGLDDLDSENLANKNENITSDARNHKIMKKDLKKQFYHDNNESDKSEEDIEDSFDEEESTLHKITKFDSDERDEGSHENNDDSHSTEEDDSSTSDEGWNTRPHSEQLDRESLENIGPIDNFEPFPNINGVETTDSIIIKNVYQDCDKTAWKPILSSQVFHRMGSQ
ncbi:hypothetical protein QAD02_006534 [Eretmocerus hayati]|uniref:Uncharacterized protein n=1 Tax=Eretmocerus hayati TaxID=131215 RepID=A0ACC2N3H4_9HYME|nr:hypothetical protein QAD02_006534 [Eretmocerus hayati]